MTQGATTELTGPAAVRPAPVIGPGGRPEPCPRGSDGSSQFIEFARIALVVAMGLGLVQGGCGDPGDSPGRRDPSGAEATCAPPARVPPEGASGAVTTIRPVHAEHVELIRAARTGPARVRLRKHLDLHPEDGQAAFLFGLSYHQEKSYGEAVAWYDRALETEPDFAMTHYWRGWARLYLGLAAEAGEDFERFLEVRPNDDDAWFAMGLLALETGRLDEAEARFRRALELLKGGPPRPTVRSRNLTRLADVALQRDRPDEAMELLRRAAELHEDNYEAHYKIHQLQVRAGETEAAERTRVLFEQAYRRVHPEVRFPE